jgi:hypothetical protein
MKRKYIGLIAIGLLIFFVEGINYAFNVGLKSDDELTKRILFAIGTIVLIWVFSFFYRNDPKFSVSVREIFFDPRMITMIILVSIISGVAAAVIVKVLGSSKYMPILLLGIFAAISLFEAWCYDVIVLKRCGFFSDIFR